MKLDVRIPIGGLFALDGAILTVYGLLADPAKTIGKAGSNITLTWGVVMLVFGGLMLGLAMRSRRAESPK